MFIRLLYKVNFWRKQILAQSQSTENEMNWRNCRICCDWTDRQSMWKCAFTFWVNKWRGSMRCEHCRRTGASVSEAWSFWPSERLRSFPRRGAEYWEDLFVLFFKLKKVPFDPHSPWTRHENVVRGGMHNRCINISYNFTASNSELQWAQNHFEEIYVFKERIFHRIFTSK